MYFKSEKKNLFTWAFIYAKSILIVNWIYVTYVIYTFRHNLSKRKNIRIWYRGEWPEKCPNERNKTSADIQSIEYLNMVQQFSMEGQFHCILTSHLGVERWTDLNSMRTLTKTPKKLISNGLFKALQETFTNILLIQLL